ncbi:MAG: GNAT family N-acetyltransferase [Bacteriovoracaceae bacterium]|nr:GNAT family N-acetyltransferase [Bacteriovoracaceae bacterium]
MENSKLEIKIRRYKRGEEKAIWQVYFRSTREVVSKEYTLDQVKRWAPDSNDLTEWIDRISQRNPFVAVVDNIIVGFAELETDGHIDMFYCLPEWIAKGVGTQLFECLEQEAIRTKMKRIFAESSTLAIRFFKSKGFQVIEERVNIVCNAPAKQYIIEKKLS